MADPCPSYCKQCGKKGFHESGFITKESPEGVKVKATQYACDNCGNIQEEKHDNVQYNQL